MAQQRAAGSGTKAPQKLSLVKDRMPRRVTMTLVGILLTALCVAFFRKVAWGVDPFTCFVEVLEHLTGRPYSLVFPIAQGVLLVITYVFGRRYIGLGTLLSLFGIGTFVDIYAKVLNRIVPSPDMTGRVVLFVLGFAVLCVGSSLYITADLGVSSYDAMSLIMTDRHFAKYRVCRILTDCFCVVFGFVFRGNIGLATVLTAFFMGPAVGWLNEKMSAPILYGRNAKIEPAAPPQ